MIVVLLFFLFCVSDWLLLGALPSLHLSFAPGIGLPLAASLLIRSSLLGGLSAAVLLARRSPPSRVTVLLFLAVNMSFTAAQLDAYVLEPLLVETTEASLAFEKVDSSARPVRVVHLTDTHIERSSYREAEVIRRVNALRPDIVVMTGDYLNLSYVADPVAADHFRHFVAQLQAPYGIYAVRGTVESMPGTMARLVEGTRVVWLEQEAVTVDVRGHAVTLVGIACSHEQEVDAARLVETLEEVPPSNFTLLLYHSPDLVREAAELGVDLYVAGHTHGGQLRLPFYGPVVTFSRYGRRYASGLFQEGSMVMVVSRGLGFEGGGMPRARFLCRPEIVSIELRGTGN